MLGLLVASASLCAAAYHGVPTPAHQFVPASTHRTRGRCVACAQAEARPTAPPGPPPFTTGYAAVKVQPFDGWFADAAATSPAPSSPVLAPLRAAAAAALSTIYFPGRKDEPFRRCDLSSLQASRLVPSVAKDASAAAALAVCSDADSAGMRLVLVDGVCSQALSDLSALPEGVSVGSLNTASGAALDGALAALQGPLPESGANTAAVMNTLLGVYGFAALNQASLADVCVINVPEGVTIERPLHVVLLSSGGAAVAPKQAPGTEGAAPVLPASHPNLFVSLAEGASLQLAQHYFACDAQGACSVRRAHACTSRPRLHPARAHGAGAHSGRTPPLEDDLSPCAAPRPALLLPLARLVGIHTSVLLSSCHWRDPCRPHPYHACGSCVCSPYPRSPVLVQRRDPRSTRSLRDAAALVRSGARSHVDPLRLGAGRRWRRRVVLQHDAPVGWPDRAH